MDDHVTALLARGGWQSSLDGTMHFAASASPTLPHLGRESRILEHADLTFSAAQINNAGCYSISARSSDPNAGVGWGVIDELEWAGVDGLGWVCVVSRFDQLALRFSPALGAGMPAFEAHRGSIVSRAGFGDLSAMGRWFCFCCSPGHCSWLEFLIPVSVWNIAATLTSTVISCRNTGRCWRPSPP